MAINDGFEREWAVGSVHHHHSHVSPHHSVQLLQFPMSSEIQITSLSFLSFLQSFISLLNENPFSCTHMCHGKHSERNQHDQGHDAAHLDVYEIYKGLITLLSNPAYHNHSQRT